MEDKVIVLTGDELGRGDTALGQIVLANFLRTLVQRQGKPTAVFCVNSAVRLVCSGAEAFEAQEHLRELAAQGVSVLACRTCLEHFGLVDKMLVGEIAGMPQFVDLLAKHQVVTL